MRPCINVGEWMFALVGVVSLGAVTSQWALAQMPGVTFDGKSVQQWIVVLQEGNANEREQAAKALGAVGRRASEVVGPLVGALKDQSPQVRRAAVISSGLSGPAASAALPELKALQNDRDDEVRRIAASVVRRLSARPEPQPSTEPSVTGHSRATQHAETPAQRPVRGGESEMVVSPEGILLYKDGKLDTIVPKAADANLAFEQRRYAVAADGYSKALAWANAQKPGVRNQQILEIHLKRAKANYALGKTDEAFRDLYSIVFFPEGKEIDWNETNDFSNGIIKFVSEIIEQHPNDPRAYELRGAMFSRECKDQESLVDYTKLIELTRGKAEAQADAYGRRAHIYMNLGEREQALRDVNRGLAIYPSEECYFRRALLYEDATHYAGALADLTILIERGAVKSPRSPVYLETRARVYRQTGNSAAALKDLDRALERDPMNLTARGKRVLVYYDLGKDELAEAEMERLKQDASYFAEQLQTQINETKLRR